MSLAPVMDVALLGGELGIAACDVNGARPARGGVGPRDTAFHGEVHLERARALAKPPVGAGNPRWQADRLQNANSFRDTAEVLRMTRAGVGWMAVGCARGAYENALAYAVSREQFGRPIAGFQLVQDLSVRMLGNITSSWALCARLSQLQDEGLAEDRHSSLAKAWCTVRMRETVGYARELLGGNEILLEHNVGRFVADAEAIYSYEGTREMNTLIVGRAITGLSAFV